MSGDVFGNGMLLSEHIRLVAAFDHRHVFLDPDPDPAVSFAERRAAVRPAPLVLGRLRPGAAQPRRRGPLPHRQVGPGHARRSRRGSACPSGTTVTEPRASSCARCCARPSTCSGTAGSAPTSRRRRRPTREVGDKANDAVRVDGAELRVRVVGEGGNLGLTQRGRVEAARAGVSSTPTRSTTPPGSTAATTRSTSRSCSTASSAKGELGEDERNAPCGAMTDDVARLVLRNNDEQNRTLSVEGARSPAVLLPAHRRFLEVLEAAGDDRPRSSRPCRRRPNSTAGCRDGDGLTMPELSVLLAHAKISLTGAAARQRPAGRGLGARDAARLLPGASSASASPTGSPSTRCGVRSPTTVLVNDVVARGRAHLRLPRRGGDRQRRCRRRPRLRRRPRRLRAQGELRRSRGARRAGAGQGAGAAAAAAPASARPSRALVPARPAGGHRCRVARSSASRRRSARWPPSARHAARPGPGLRAGGGRRARRRKASARRGAATGEPAVRLPAARRGRGRRCDRSSRRGGGGDLVRLVRPVRLRQAADRASRL